MLMQRIMFKVNNSLILLLQIGTVLKKLFDEGVVKREDLWITSKLWFVYQYINILDLIN
jgi:uncharacterized membrane protein SirB2